MQTKRTLTQWQGIVRDNLENIREWRASGFQIRQICKKLDMTEVVYYLLLHQMPEFKLAHEVADIRLLQEFIEPTLIDRAKNGFRFTETTESVLIDADGVPIRDKNGELQYYVSKKVHKTVQSNAMLVMLAKNLDKKRWGSNADENEANNNPLLADDMKDLID